MPRAFDDSQMSIRVLTLTGVSWFLTGPSRLSLYVAVCSLFEATSQSSVVLVGSKTDSTFR